MPEVPAVEWVYVWQGLEGPSVGGPYPTMEAAMDALAVDWAGFERPNCACDQPCSDCRADFEEEYAESPDLWVTTLARP